MSRWAISHPRPCRGGHAAEVRRRPPTLWGGGRGRRRAAPGSWGVAEVRRRRARCDKEDVDEPRWADGGGLATGRRRGV